MNLEIGGLAEHLQVHALHDVVAGGAAVGVAYLDSSFGGSSTGWGSAGPKLIVMTHPADFDGDLRVQGDDLGVFLGHWQSADQDADLNSDGAVSGADLGIVLGAMSSQNSIAEIGQWDCEKGEWHAVPVIAAAETAALLFGFGSLQELGELSLSMPPDYRESLLAAVSDMTRVLIAQ